MPSVTRILSPAPVSDYAVVDSAASSLVLRYAAIFSRRRCSINVLDHDAYFLNTAWAPGKLGEIGHAVRRPVVDGGSTIVGGEIGPPRPSLASHSWLWSWAWSTMRATDVGKVKAIAAVRQKWRCGRELRG